MSTIPRTHAATAAPTARDPFAERYGVPLPRDLAQLCTELSWSQFVDTFAPMHGRIRIDSWRVRPGRPIPVYEARIFAGQTAVTERVPATGPVAALTSMLHGFGCGIEILAFHQRAVADGVATFVLGERGGRRHWSFAIHGESAASALAAVVAGANVAS